MIWALPLLGAGFSAAGMLAQGKTTEQQMEYQAQIAKQDAKMAQEAAYADASAMRREAERIESANITTIAKSGVAFEGSPMDVLAENAALAELDVQNRMYSGFIQSTSKRMEAGMLRQSAKGVMPSAMLGAAGGLLSGAGQSYGMYKSGV